VEQEGRRVRGSTEYLLYLYAESPVHAGAADSQGVLDLPIQREAPTGYPVIWGQSLKGALRQAAADTGWGALVSDVFGPDVDQAGGSGLEAGRLVVGDAQLVALPVATLRRTFAWVTTGLALSRLARKYTRLGREVPATPRSGSVDAVSVGAPWVGSVREVLGPCVAEVAAQQDTSLAAWAKRIATDAVGRGEPFVPFADKLAQDLLMVSDDLARPLLSECTEIAVRVQLGEGKTVKNGPFHTEYLPTETVLAASLTLRGPKGPGQDPAPDRLRGLLDGTLQQIGGDETIGKGLVWCRLLASTRPPAGAAAPAPGIGAGA
jgi:CRISPR-associated protein Cmr4